MLKKKKPRVPFKFVRFPLKVLALTFGFFRLTLFPRDKQFFFRVVVCISARFFFFFFLQLNSYAMLNVGSDFLLCAYIANYNIKIVDLAMAEPDFRMTNPGA